MASDNRDVQRRTWDVEAFAKRAAEREQAEREQQAEQAGAGGSALRHKRRPVRLSDHQDDDPFAPTRAWLQRRTQSVDFNAKVGQTEVVGHAQGGGFECKLCGTVLKDSNRFLTHVNSRNHQKNLGMSMRVRRSTAEEIRQAFAQAVQRRQSQKSAIKPP